MNFELKIACFLLKYYQDCETLTEIYNFIVTDE